MVKRRVGSERANLTPTHKKSIIALKYVHGSCMPHIAEKFSTRATTFFWTSFQSEVWTRSHGPPKCRKSQLGNLGTKWHLDVALVANHKEYYKGEGGDFPKSRPWWVLFGLCKFLWIIDPLVTHPSPHPRASTRPSTLEVLCVKENTPTPFFVVFIFGLTFEYFKECGGVSYGITTLVEVDPPIGEFRWHQKRPVS
jgi:hypothetical protein